MKRNIEDIATSSASVQAEREEMQAFLRRHRLAQQRTPAEQRAYDEALTARRARQDPKLYAELRCFDRKV